MSDAGNELMALVAWLKSAASDEDAPWYNMIIVAEIARASAWLEAFAEVAQLHSLAPEDGYCRECECDEDDDADRWPCLTTKVIDTVKLRPVLRLVRREDEDD